MLQLKSIMKSRLVSLFSALCLLFTIAPAHAAETPLDPQPAITAGKISAETWRKIESGEVRDLLVLFDDPAIDAEIKSHVSGRKLRAEDDAALALRATRYRQLKERAVTALKPNEATLRKDYRHIPMRLLRFHDRAGLLRLLQRPEVAAVMEDGQLYPHLSQSLPLIGQPAVAQTIGRTGAGYTVAVLDTGVDYTRAEFGSCTAPGVPVGCKVVAALDMATEDNARDANGHGTWVAGTVAGTAPGAGIAAIDVFNGASASSSDVLAGIDWAINNRTAYNIVAINLSLGDGVKYISTCSNKFTNPYRQPIINALNAGILTITSSGNEGYTDGLSSPACTPEAVSVGAVYDANAGSLAWSACTDSTTVADKVACFSNSASFLTLLAPGALITVTGATVGGTSLASPFASGAAAVMAQAFPGDTATTRLGRLTASGKAMTDSRNSIVKPRLDLLAAQGAAANDAFAAATTLSGDSGSASGWNHNATKEASEPAHAGDSGGKSVWWTWTASATGTLNLHTHGSGFDTLLAVYTGSAVNSLAQTAANDNDGGAGSTSGLGFHANAGTAYRIAVDGKAAAAGGIVMGWSFTPDPPPSADLEIAVLDTPDPATLGGQITYTLTVVNHGPDTAQTVHVSHLLPAGATFVSAGAGCLHAAGVVTCELGNLISGQQGSRDVVVSANSVGVMASQVSVASATADNNAVNDLFTATTTVLADAGGSAANDSDVPLPPWSLFLLAAGMLTAMLRRGARPD